MARVSSSVTRKAKHSKVLKAAKGYYGARSRCFKTAKQAVTKAGQYAYRDRRAKKRTFRALWIQRINAAARLCDISYSRLIELLDGRLNRKMLADVAARDMNTFKLIVEQLQNSADKTAAS